VKRLVISPYAKKVGGTTPHPGAGSRHGYRALRKVLRSYHAEVERDARRAAHVELSVVLALVATKTEERPKAACDRLMVGYARPRLDLQRVGAECVCETVAARLDKSMSG
jgi:hypothetical protein